MNAHGGVDGRKILPYVALDDPALTSSSLAACTQLTEDDHVFVAIAPVIRTVTKPPTTPPSSMARYPARCRRMPQLTSA